MSNLISTWSERVAFNEAYEARKISSAKEAGRDSFDLGLDRTTARDAYFEMKDQRFSEAKEFLESEDVEGMHHYDKWQFSDVEILHGEETLGMESSVSLDTEYSEIEGMHHYDEWQFD